jgi:hypothetical protein
MIDQTRRSLEDCYGAVLVPLPLVEPLEPGDVLLEPMLPLPESGEVALEPMLPLELDGLAAEFGLAAELSEPLTGPDGEVMVPPLL